MDQAAILRHLAEAERADGRAETCRELLAIAQTLEAKAARNPRVAFVLAEAAQRRADGPPQAPAPPAPQPPGTPSQAPQAVQPAPLPPSPPPQPGDKARVPEAAGGAPGAPGAMPTGLPKAPAGGGEPGGSVTLDIGDLAQRGIGSPAAPAAPGV